MRTTVRLDEDLLRAAKIKAAQEGRTLTSLLEEGLRRVLAEDKTSMRGSVGEEAARFDPGALSTAEFIARLPKVTGGSLIDSPEYMRLAEKAGSTLPSRVLAVMDEEDDLERLKQLGYKPG